MSENFNIFETGYPLLILNKPKFIENIENENLFIEFKTLIEESSNKFNKPTRISNKNNSNSININCTIKNNSFNSTIEMLKNWRESLSDNNIIERS